MCCVEEAGWGRVGVGARSGGMTQCKQRVVTKLATTWCEMLHFSVTKLRLKSCLTSMSWILEHFISHGACWVDLIWFYISGPVTGSSFSHPSPTLLSVAAPVQSSLPLSAPLSSRHRDWELLMLLGRRQSSPNFLSSAKTHSIEHSNISFHFKMKYGEIAPHHCYHSPMLPWWIMIYLMVKFGFVQDTEEHYFSLLPCQVL